MNEFLAQNLHFTLQAVDLLRQSGYANYILIAIVAAVGITAYCRPFALPIIPLGPLCSVVMGNWFWFAFFLTKNGATEQDWLENTVIALVVGLVMGVVVAVGLATAEVRNHWDYDLHQMVRRQGGNVALCCAAMPLVCLVAEVLAVVGLGAALSIGQNPMEWLLAACLVAGLFGTGGGAILIVFL